MSDVTEYRHGHVPRRVRESQILALAEELFAERGYAGVTMNELARRAGGAAEAVAHWWRRHPGEPAERVAGRLTELLVPGLRHFVESDT